MKVDHGSLEPFELRDTTGRLWTSETLKGCKAILFCFATW